MLRGTSSATRTSTGFGHPVLNVFCYGFLLYAALYPLKVSLPNLIGSPASASAEAQRIAGLDPLARALLVVSPFHSLLGAMDARVPGEEDKALVRHLLAAWWVGALFTVAGALPLLLVVSIRDQVSQSLPRGGYRVVEGTLAGAFLAAAGFAFSAGHFWFTPGAARMGLLDAVALGLPIVLSTWAVVRLASLGAVAFFSPGEAALRRPQKKLEFSRSPRAAARGDFVCSSCAASIDAAPFWSGIEISCPACGQPTTLRFSGSDRRYEITYEEFRRLLTEKEARDALSPVLVMQLRCAVEDDGKTLVLKDGDGQPIGLQEAHVALQADEATQKWIHDLAMQRGR